MEQSFWRKYGRGFLVLAVLVLVQVLFLADTLGDYWFEDDAPHRVFVRDHSQPLAYFGPKLVSQLSFGHAVTPWFPFTFWIDHQMSATNPQPAYFHTAFSLWLTACVVLILLSRFMPLAGALGASCLWLFVPSTTVITEFLSTRHYLEGLLFSCVSILFCLRSLEANAGKRYVFLAGGMYLLACTTKEVYVSATFFALVAAYVLSRRWIAAAGMFLCGGFYAVYRLVSLGLVGKNLGSSFAEHYHLFLMRWPYIFAGNEGGYALFGGAVLLVVYLLWRRRLGWKAVVVLGGLIGVMLLTIFPVSANVTYQYRELGTWYRVVFLFNGFMLCVGAWLVSRLENRRAAWTAGVLATLILLPGSWQTTRRWDEMKALATADAHFYVRHEDRLLYSQLPATWYIYGIHHLYFEGQEPRYLTWRVDNATTAPYVLDKVRTYDEIWVAGENGHVPDKELLAVIEANCEADVTPLHKGWKEDDVEP